MLNCCPLTLAPCWPPSCSMSLFSLEVALDMGVYPHDDFHWGGDEKTVAPWTHYWRLLPYLECVPSCHLRGGGQIRSLIVAVERSTTQEFKQWCRGPKYHQLSSSSKPPMWFVSFIEGSLEVKLPTIWTDEKQSREEAERRGRLEERRVEEKE